MELQKSSSPWRNQKQTVGEQEHLKVALQGTKDNHNRSSNERVCEHPI